MNNKKKIITLLIIATLIGLPYWRINSNSKFFVDGLMVHLNHLGTWSHQSIETSLNGKVTIKGVEFTPRGYRQSINIQSIEAHSDMRKLLFSGSQELITHIPKNMTLYLNEAKFASNGQDLVSATNQNAYWPMTVGYLGAFGCGQGTGPSFTDAQWKKIFPTLPSFNMELNYALVDAYHLDFNLNVNSINNWFIAWSGTLTRTSDVDKITFNDTIIDTLYYYHVDQGFNKKRNDFCANENNSSYAAYRLKSAEEIQKYLRVYAGKEMPQFLNNQYQRSLAENIEVNAIFKLSTAKYLYEFASMSQQEFLTAADIEAALGENEYQKIELADIDYLELDMETLRAEMEAKQKEAARIEKEAQKPNELLKTVVHKMGVEANEFIVNDWNQAIGKNIKVKTKRGRPIFGKLLSISNTHLSISSRYMHGNATITVAKKDVVTMTVNR